MRGPDDPRFDFAEARVQDRPKRGFVWVFHGHDEQSGGQLALYVFAADRSGETPVKVLGRTGGALVVDGYTGYNAVADPQGRARGGCRSHLRRRIYEARATSAPADTDRAEEPSRRGTRLRDPPARSPRAVPLRRAYPDAQQHLRGPPQSHCARGAQLPILRAPARRPQLRRAVLPRRLLHRQWRRTDGVPDRRPCPHPRRDNPRAARYPAPRSMAGRRLRRDHDRVHRSLRRLLQSSASGSSPRAKLRTGARTELLQCDGSCTSRTRVEASMAKVASAGSSCRRRAGRSSIRDGAWPK